MNTLTEERALKLLGDGLPSSAVAAALGISESRVSQLISDPEFAGRVAELRFKNLSSQTERDSKYDTLEDELIEKLKNQLPLMYRTPEILAAMKIVNGAKRRGAETSSPLASQATVLNITLPMKIIQQFTTNLNNQVVKTGDQDLVTIQSGNMTKLISEVPNDVLIPRISPAGESIGRSRNPEEERTASAEEQRGG
jgi:predicted transcriptional regulator